MSRGVFVTDEQVRLTGSPNVARFLAQCLYWSENKVSVKRQGWFYKSRDEWQAETWLSRYQQEKARTQLRTMGVLKERRERTNSGIRIWFWVDQALLNLLLNNLVDQTEQKETEDCSVELYDSSLTIESDNRDSGQLDNCKELRESKSLKDINTIVPKTPLSESNNGLNGTLVLDNKTNELKEDSDNNCSDNTESVDNFSQAESDKKEAAAPFLSDLSNQSDNAEYSENPDDYKACHPFIYQFMRSRILTGCDWSDTALDLFRRDGFSNTTLQDALRAFIDQYGHSMIAWYQEHTPIPVNPLKQHDLELAVLVSQGGFK